MSTVLRQVELVAGTARDIATVERLMGDAFDPKYGEAWTAGQCLGVMALPGVWLTVARVDERSAGFALARAVADEAELLLLATDPAQRRRGIGATLLRGVIADAQLRRCHRLHLEVRAGNPAIALYRAQGFAQVGERRAYYRGGDGVTRDAQTYARAL